MDFNNFTPYSASLGGILIGIAASMLLLFNGKICGISGITGQILTPKKGDSLWRICFFLGLVCGGFAIFQIYPTFSTFNSNTSIGLLIASGFLVGYGTRLGNGCTSGHGVCGISRFSVRSIIATCVFMFAGMVSVYIVRHVVGG